MRTIYRACRVLSLVAIGLIAASVPARAQRNSGGIGYWTGVTAPTFGTVQAGALGVGVAPPPTGIAMAGTYCVTWSGNIAICGVGAGTGTLTNAGGTVGIGFDVGVDSTLKIRNRAQNSYGDVWLARAFATTHYNINDHVLLSDVPATDGTFNITNGGGTAGVGFDVSVDSTLAIRNRAHSTYGNLTAAIVSGSSLFATHATLGGVVGQLVTVATNDDPTENVRQNRITTTDATVTTIETLVVPAGTTLAIRCDVMNRRTGGAAGTAEDGAYYEIKVVVKGNAGNNASEVAAEVVGVVGESQAAWTVTAAPSGGNELIQVTGAINNNITWHSHCRTYPVAS